MTRTRPTWGPWNGEIVRQGKEVLAIMKFLICWDTTRTKEKPVGQECLCYRASV